MTKKQVLILIGIGLVILAIPLTLYLVRQTQIFAPKAAFSPKLEFINDLGQPITETTLTSVKLKISKETVTPQSPSPSLSPISVSSKRVFVTSTFYNGNLGGLDGADQKCQDRANSASLGGTWKAWLSISGSVNAKDRIPDAEYRRLDNVIVANDKADLTDGTLDNPISTTELGTSVIDLVWTGTQGSGIGANETCDGWIKGVAGSFGNVGLAEETGSDWTYALPRGIHQDLCFAQNSLYCFEQ